MYYNPSGSVNQLQERMTDEVKLPKENQQMIKTVVRAMKSKAQLCVNKNREHAEENVV